MAAASANNGSISMIVEKWTQFQVEQFSPVHLINGYPWRARLFKYSNESHGVELICDKSNEAELWECNANVTFKEFFFSSWGIQREVIRFVSLSLGSKVELLISANDGKSWRCRPTLGLFDPRDGILVIRDEKKKIHVNKQSLAAVSPFFDRLFNGDFKEKNMGEIPIEDVEYEEFFNIIKIVYNSDAASVTDQNCRRILELADRFDLKIVEDRVVSYLLSSSSRISIHQKLLISEQCNLPFLKDRILPIYDKKQLIAEFCDSPESDEVSPATLKYLLKKCCSLTN